MISNNEYPINPELRSPEYSKSKADVGLSRVDNLSYTDIQGAILANVQATINEGSTYYFDKTVSNSDGSRLIELVRLKPHSSHASLLISLGAWYGNYKFLAEDAIRLDITLSSDDIIGYNLWVNNTQIPRESYVDNDELKSDTSLSDNNGIPINSTSYTPDESNQNGYEGYTPIVGLGPYPKSSTGEIASSETPFYYSQLVIRKLTENRGWVVLLKSVVKNEGRGDWNAIWINYLDARNIDPLNPNTITFEASTSYQSGSDIIIRTIKSRISSNVSFDGVIDGIVAYSNGLSHDIPILLSSNDPDDWYNSEYNKDKPSAGSRKPDEVDEFPDDGVLTSITAPGVGNAISLKTNREDCKKDQNIPITVNRLNHLVNFRLGDPSGTLDADCIDKDYLRSINLDYSQGINNHENPITKIDTRIGANNYFPVSISKLSHPIVLGLKSTKYSYDEYDSDGNVSGTVDTERLYASIMSPDNLEANVYTPKKSYIGIDEETGSWVSHEIVGGTRFNSYGLSTEFDKSNELPLQIHGLDHRIKLRVAGHVHGSLDIDTFEKGDQTINLYFTDSEGGDEGAGGKISFKFSKDIIPISGTSLSLNITNSNEQVLDAQVVDSRYSDAARGLALFHSNSGKELPYNDSRFNSTYEVANGEYDAPLINGVVFTGNPKITWKGGSTRVITIPAYHKGRGDTFSGGESKVDNVGYHDWNCLSRVPLATIDSEGTSKYSSKSILKQNSELATTEESYSKNSGYGLMKFTSFDTSKIGLEELVNSITDQDNTAVPFGLLKEVIARLTSYISKLEGDLYVAGKVVSKDGFFEDPNDKNFTS